MTGLRESHVSTNFDAAFLDGCISSRHHWSTAWSKRGMEYECLTFLAWIVSTHWLLGKKWRKTFAIPRVYVDVTTRSVAFLGDYQSQSQANSINALETQGTPSIAPGPEYTTSPRLPPQGDSDACHPSISHNIPVRMARGECTYSCASRCTRSRVEQRSLRGLNSQA